MLMLPYTKLFGIECRKDTLIATGVMALTVIFSAMAVMNRLSVNNTLTRKDLVDTITTVVKENSRTNIDLATHFETVTQRQDDQDKKVKDLLDQEKLNQTHLQAIAELVSKNTGRHITTPPSGKENE